MCEKYPTLSVQKSLRTSSERVALAKKKRIEYEVSLGDLHVASRLRVPVVLDAFCKHLEVTLKKADKHKCLPALIFQSEAEGTRTLNLRIDSPML